MKLVYVCLLLFAAPALAEDRGRARVLLKQARQHYNLAEYDQALRSFREAYRNFEDPSFLFNIGQCERQLGHKTEAVHAYRAYLNNSRDSSSREEVKQLIARLEGELAEEKRTQSAPPTGVEEAKPELTVAHVDLTVQPPPPRPARTPAYKKWWVWTLVGVAVAGGVSAGLAVGLTRHPSDPTASTDLGTVRPF